MKQTTSHSTNDEKDFIDGIGTFGEKPGDKATLLRGYINGMNKREKFGSIDKQQCLAYANKKLYEVSGLIG